jgi:hypothetical protein
MLFSIATHKVKFSVEIWISITIFQLILKVAQLI